MSKKREKVKERQVLWSQKVRKKLGPKTQIVKNVGLKSYIVDGKRKV